MVSRYRYCGFDFARVRELFGTDGKQIVNEIYRLILCRFHCGSVVPSFHNQNEHSSGK